MNTCSACKNPMEEKEEYCLYCRRKIEDVKNIRSLTYLRGDYEEYIEQKGKKYKEGDYLFLRNVIILLILIIVILVCILLV